MKHTTSNRPANPGSRVSRWLWFIGLYLAAIAAVAAVTYLLHILIVPTR